MSGEMPEPFDFTLSFDLDGDEEIELHCRKHALRHAREWGLLKEYRRERLEIRHRERARREQLRRK